jgi:hypothetical protein
VQGLKIWPPPEAFGNPLHRGITVARVKQIPAVARSKVAHLFSIQEDTLDLASHHVGNTTHGCHLQRRAEDQATVGGFDIRVQHAMKAGRQVFPEKDDIWLDQALATRATGDLRVCDNSGAHGFHILYRRPTFDARGRAKVSVTLHQGVRW